MKSFAIVLLSSGLLAGCASSGNDFFQSGIIITPPARVDWGGSNVTVLETAGPTERTIVNANSPVMADGGTVEGTIIDAKGRRIPIFIDHRIETRTPGAYYLRAYPSRWWSVRVRDEAKLKKVLGWK